MLMPDISAIIQGGANSSANSPWLYLPLAVVLGALHALEPGHSKSMMAAFIVAVRGNTIVVWALAVLGLTFGPRLSFERLEPWLLLISGVLIIAMAVRLLALVRGHQHAHHEHDHHHHDHDHDHGAADAHAAAHGRDIETRFGGRTSVTNGEIAWFGFTGGLLPCPSAIAVLLVCLQLKAFTLGVAMVAAFSLGLALSLAAVGVAAAWGAQKASEQWGGFGTWAERLPVISALIVMAMGVLMSARGLWQLGYLGR
jgi:nickel/cobalt transporter (NicO) family protein